MAREISNHGASGYRQGCKCGVCRGAHADYVRDWRARRRAAAAAAANADSEPLVVTTPPTEPVVTPAGLNMSAPNGVLEAALLDDLREPDDKVAFRHTYIGMARLNARILDQAATIDRLDLVSPLQLRQFELLQRIALLGFKGLDDAGAGAGHHGEADGVAAEAEAILAAIEQEGRGSESGRQA
ncbi:MAG: hypothetical protein J0I40_05775 [Cellulomonas sp.]|nr:hypothetical protein [Cellulomonas sp.]OJV76497.1 MAG: hypothetical protein BGO37_10590 [Cellulomonas sp. 73-92]